VRAGRAARVMDRIASHREGVRTFGVSAVALAALMAIVVGAGGHSAGAALRALWEGSFGDWYALTSATLVRTTPLILTGLGVTLAFRAGVWNIGAEGQLLAGAAAAAIVALGMAPSLGAGALPLALAAGAAGGAIWAGVAALLRQRYGVLEVISTIMLNFIAAYLVGYLVRGPLQEGSHIYPQSSTLAPVVQLPRLIAGSRLHWGLIAALAAAPAMWWGLAWSAAGFRVRVVGGNPDAARSAGEIDVPRVRTRAFLLSGAFAGFAGAVQLTGVTFALYEDLSPGYGFTAIAVALLARLNPLAVVPAAILFAGLESGALAMQRDAGIPSVTVSIVEGALILLALATWAGSPSAPSSFFRRSARPDGERST